MKIDGDAAAVVADADGVAGLVQNDLDLVGEAVDVLIDGVINDLPDEMVQAGLIDAADVHRGSFANRFESFEQLEVSGCVFFRSDGRHEFLSVLRPNRLSHHWSHSKSQKKP